MIKPSAMDLPARKAAATRDGTASFMLIAITLAGLQ
jgi:hypothetical protein